MSGHAPTLHALKLGLLGFAACMGTAITLYPGGTFRDPQSPGYAFWDNYWCDLLDPVALSGEDNLWGSRFARAAFAVFALVLLRFWPLAAAWAQGGTKSRLAVSLGRAGAISLLLVSATSSVSEPEAHAVAVTASAGAGVVSALLLLPALHARTDRLTASLGIALALTTTVTLLQYVRQGITRANYAAWLPASQKLATLLLLAWMVRLIWLIGRATRTPP